MPDAPLRPCSGCGVLGTKGRCASCARAKEQRRGSSTERGYGSQWQRFRVYFTNCLIHHQIVPVCGAVLPTGPNTSDSLCAADGLLNADDLELDHEPPLRDDERRHQHLVCDPRRVQFLCKSCHSRKTERQNAGLSRLVNA